MAVWGSQALHPAAAVALVLSTFGVAGCANVLGVIAYYLSPPHIQKAEFEPTAGRLVVLIEDVRPTEDQPVFRAELHSRLVELFREKKIRSTIVPLDEMNELRRSDPDFDKMSLQAMGRALRAEQVLYIRLQRFDVRESPGHPLLTPSVRMQLKVLSVGEPKEHARLWPKDVEWRELEVRRPAEEAASPEQVDIASRKLAYDSAQYIVRYFHDYDMEDRVPKER